MFTNVEIVGRLTRDPELRQTGNGTNVANISLAVNRDFKNDEVDFFDVTCWQKLAELVSAHKSKGDLVLVQGNLRQDRFKGEDGGNRSKVYVVANRVVFLPSKSDGDGGGNNSPSVEPADDIPF